MTAEYLEKAKAFLEKGYTCAIVGSGMELSSKRRGVAPLLEWVNEGRKLFGGVAADKVVGKAAAFLYVLLSVRAVYAQVISLAAEKVFQEFGITCIYDKRVDRIMNRDKTGFCPMERAVWETDDPTEAYAEIQKKYTQLQQGE
ncbi:MAG: DUF1893 domain-containing protein [Clostridia bacterium]|nr:DUF1893 domain-containing protein [Clostridia bacterium]